MDEPDFTMGDLRQQLAAEYGFAVDGSAGEDGVYTTTELCKSFGVSRHKMITILRDKFERGEVEVVLKRVETFGGLRKQGVQAYRLKRKGDDDGQD